MDILSGYRLSTQQQLLFQSQQHRLLPHAQLAIRLKGDFNRNWLKQAVERIIQQDTVFRTNYIKTAGMELPVQVVNESAGYFFIESITDDTDAGREELLQTAARQVFDLEQGPLLRVDVAAAPGNLTLVAVTIPALCADYCSVTVLADHLISGYLAAGQGGSAGENEVLPYLQFSEWQHQLWESEGKSEGLAYWNAGSHDDRYWALPFDEDPWQQTVFEAAVFECMLPLQQQLAAFDQDRLEPALGLCWYWLLWLLGDRRPAVMGHMNTGRDFEELNRTLGLFSRCLPVSAQFTEATPFHAALNAYYSVLQANDEYKVFYMPQGGPAPLAYVFEYLDMPLRFKEAREQNAELIEILQRQAPPEATCIQLRCIREEEVWRLAFCYNKNAFTKTSIQLLGEMYTHILAQCLSDVNVTPASLRLLPDAKLRQILERFNSNRKIYPGSDLTVDALFDEQVRLYPGKAAIVADNRQLTYGELQARVNTLAAWLLKEMDVKPGDMVALMCRENEHLIIGMLAILKAGAAYVPLDPSTPAARIQFILEDSNAAVLITQRALLAHAVGYAGATLCLEEVSWEQYAGIASPVARNVDSVAYVIYTSGTTGKPKGVLITDHSLVNYVCWLKDTFHITANDSAVLLSSFAFDLGYTSIWGMLLGGGCLHLVPENIVKQPEAVVQYVAEQGITFIKTTPSLFNVIVHAANATRLAACRLRLLLLGGEPIRVRDLEKMVSIKPGITLVNHYGPTETTIGTVTGLIDNQRLRAYAAQPVIGRPIANNFVSILDKEGRNVAPGMPGELCVSGAGLAKGYLNRDELSREKFVPHPLYNDRLMYRTGDLASWTPEGNIRFIGRIDDQVKIRGYRVELNEVQQALLQHAGIRRAAVTVVESDDLGRELAAYYESETPVAAQELRALLSALLPEPFIPSYFIPVKTLPLTANGKLDKAALPPVYNFTESSFAAPRNETEVEMATLWQTLLGKPQVGIKDDFFDLGGHSLKAIQLATHIHKQFNVKIEISKIFANPTVEQLSALVAATATQKFQGIRPLELRPAYELSHAQHRLWILSQFEDGTAAYNVPSATLLKGPLDTAAFRRALDALVARHENLRTVFVTTDGHPMQRILPVAAAGFVMQEKDLRGLENAAGIVEEWITADMHAPFDLEKGPLLRATLVRMEEEQYVFLFNIHHIVSDGWSRGLLARELLYYYRLYAGGKGEELPPLRLQYKDYAAWHSGVYQSQAGYWQQLYSDGVPVLNFPTDFERPAVLSFTGAAIQRTLPAAVTVKLQGLAQQQGSTLNNLMFALYGMLLAHYTGQQELVIGSLVSGRSHVDLENMLGVFINFLPVRVKVNTADSLDEYLRNTHQLLLQAYQHQDYPFDLMVETCIQGRDMSHNPFFDTMVNFHSENGMIGQEIMADEALAGTGVQVRPYLPGGREEVHSVLDFKLDIHPANDTLELYFSYNSKLFTAARMETFLSRYIALLEAVLETPSQPLEAYFPWQPGDNAAGVFAATPVNICASFVAEPLGEYLQYWNTEFEMELQVNFAPYNQVFQQLYNESSLLYNSNGINVLLVRVEDWIRDVPGRPASAQLALLEQACNELQAAFRYSRERMFVPYLVGLVPLSPDRGHAPEIVEALHRVNTSLEAFFTNTAACYLLDMEAVASLYAVDEMFDGRSDEVGHMPFSAEYYAALGTLLARKVRAWKAKPYKVIALDCDNTLWKGICGEAGPLGVEIDENFAALQQFLIKKYEEGFLLAITSKNNEADVWEVFDTHPGMQLRRSHIAAHRINWEHKAGNILELANELNLGVDSFIFLDDSLFEVEQMSAACPGVLALALPANAAEISGFLHHNWAFDRLHVTLEDQQRNEMYKAEKARKAAQGGSGSIEEFMRSLNIRVYIEPLSEAEIERAVQLMQRTSQFNLNGRQYTAGKLLDRVKDPACWNRIIRVEDRFGNYGAVGLLLADAHNGTFLLDTFLLSCRVLGRGVETVVLDALVTYAAANGFAMLEAAFEPTEKNKPFSGFLDRTGWTKVPGKRTFTLPVTASNTVS